LETHLISVMSVLNLQSTGRYTVHSSKCAPAVPARGDRAVSHASCVVRQKAQLRTSNEEFLQKVSSHSAYPSSAMVRNWSCNASSVPLCALVQLKSAKLASTGTTTQQSLAVLTVPARFSGGWMQSEQNKLQGQRCSHCGQHGCWRLQENPDAR